MKTKIEGCIYFLCGLGCICFALFLFSKGETATPFADQSPYVAPVVLLLGAVYFFAELRRVTKGHPDEDAYSPPNEDIPHEEDK